LQFFLNGCFFLFPTFSLEGKGGAKSSSRFKKDQTLRPSVAFVESAFPTTLLLLGLKGIVSSSCYATTQRALYSAYIIKE
jgi:hypothetical protein